MIIEIFNFEGIEHTFVMLTIRRAQLTKSNKVYKKKVLMCISLLTSIVD